MAKAKLEQKYHCDGYYYNNVCPSRGMQDPADIRYDKNGWTRQCRYECKTLGISPMTDDHPACPHCIEMKKFFRRARRH